MTAPAAPGFALAGACAQHPDAPVAGTCTRCGSPACALCLFWVGSAAYCPECIGAGPSDEERSSVVSRGVLSIVLAVLGALALVGTMAAGATGVSVDGFLAMVLGVVMLVLSLGGIALGLIAREGARRTGSFLPMIGVITNGVLVAVQFVFGAIGTFR
jgi:hypothetical protein